MTRKIRIAHLVNPVRNPLESSLSDDQQLTFESMRRAAEHARAIADVDLVTTQYEEDRPIIPSYFRVTPDLDRSAGDVAGCSKFRKLPLLCDLIGRLHSETDADYLIYTNVDIILHPTFYTEVSARIADGLDAFIINRRRVPNHYHQISDLDALFNDDGRSHPGFDCFVFHRSMYNKFELARVCVGIPFVGILFAQNIFCFARRFKLFDKDKLTFHVGMEVFKKRDPEYLAFNKSEFWRAIEALRPELDSRKFPWGERNVVYRLLRWGLHPSIPIRLALQLEPQRWLGRR